MVPAVYGGVCERAAGVRGDRRGEELRGVSEDGGDRGAGERVCGVGGVRGRPFSTRHFGASLDGSTASYDNLRDIYGVDSGLAGFGQLCRES